MVLVAEKPPDNRHVRSHFWICQDNFLKENLVSECVCAYVCVCVCIYTHHCSCFFCFFPFFVVIV